MQQTSVADMREEKVAKPSYIEADCWTSILMSPSDVNTKQRYFHIISAPFSNIVLEKELSFDWNIWSFF